MPWVSPKLLTAAGCDRDEASLPRHAEACSSLSIDPWWQEKPRHWRAPFEILSFVSLQWLIVSILLKLIKSINIYIYTYIHIYTLYKYFFWVVGLAVYIHVLSAWKLSHKIWADHIRTLQQLQPSFVPSSYSCEPSEEGLKDSAPCGSTAVVAPPVSFVLSPISGFQRAKAPSQPSIASNGGRFTTATSAYLGRAFRQSNGCMYASAAMWAVCSLLLLMSLWKTVKRGPLVYCLSLMKNQLNLAEYLNRRYLCNYSMCMFHLHCGIQAKKNKTARQREKRKERSQCSPLSSHSRRPSTVPRRICGDKVFSLKRTSRQKHLGLDCGLKSWGDSSLKPGTVLSNSAYGHGPKVWSKAKLPWLVVSICRMGLLSYLKKKKQIFRKPRHEPDLH